MIVGRMLSAICHIIVRNPSTTLLLVSRRSRPVCRYRRPVSRPSCGPQQPADPRPHRRLQPWGTPLYRTTLATPSQDHPSRRRCQLSVLVVGVRAVKAASAAPAPARPPPCLSSPGTFLRHHHHRHDRGSLNNN